MHKIDFESESYNREELEVKFFQPFENIDAKRFHGSRTILRYLCNIDGYYVFYNYYYDKYKIAKRIGDVAEGSLFIGIGDNHYLINEYVLDFWNTIYYERHCDSDLFEKFMIKFPNTDVITKDNFEKFWNEHKEIREKEEIQKEKDKEEKELIRKTKFESSNNLEIGSTEIELDEPIKNVVSYSDYEDLKRNTVEGAINLLVSENKSFRVGDKLNVKFNGEKWLINNHQVNKSDVARLSKIALKHGINEETITTYKGLSEMKMKALSLEEINTNGIKIPVSLTPVNSNLFIINIADNKTVREWSGIRKLFFRGKRIEIDGDVNYGKFLEMMGELYRFDKSKTLKLLEKYKLIGAI